MRRYSGRAPSVASSAMWSTTPSAAISFIPPSCAADPCKSPFQPSGRSPALARRLRIELERQFGPEYGAWVEQVGEMRQKLRRRNLPAAERRRLSDQIASQRFVRTFRRAAWAGKNRAVKDKRPAVAPAGGWNPQSLVPLPLDESRLNVDHRVHHQLNQAPV